MDIARLKEKLETIPDPRRPWGNLRHKLEDILVIGPATLLRNGEDFEDMEAFGQEREAELRTFPELPEDTGRKHVFPGVPRVNPKELSSCLCAWVAEAREPQGVYCKYQGRKHGKNMDHGEPRSRRRTGPLLR